MLGDDAQPGVEPRTADAGCVVDHRSRHRRLRGHGLTGIPGIRARAVSAGRRAGDHRRHGAAAAVATTGTTDLGRAEVAELRPGLRVPGVVERRHLDVAAAALARRSRLAGRRGSPARRGDSPLTARRRRTTPLASGSSPASESESLPELSMSSTRTVTSSPRLRTSSTRSMRLPRPSLEMWSRPSRPGRMLTNAPNLVTFTTLPGVLGAELGGGRVEDQLDPPLRLFDRRAVLGADAHRADDAVVAHRHVGAGLLGDGVDDLALGPDHLADLVHRDLEADDLRCGVLHVGAVRVDRRRPSRRGSSGGRHGPGAAPRAARRREGRRSWCRAAARSRSRACPRP